MPNYYNSGTVSVANGATTVTGSSVLWSDLLAGDTLELAGQRVTIASVTDTTHFELATAWSGTTQSGAAYLVRFDAPSRFSAYTVATQLRAALSRIAVLEQARPNYEVQSLGSNTPPGSPVDNDMYVVGTSPTGAWAGQANKLAQWVLSAWVFTAPERNTSVVSAATGDLYVWNGTTWVAQLGGTALQSLRPLAAAAGSFARFTGTGATSAVMQAIAGTVSQSGGTPTGALFESGSNGNGNYVKFADGTMICWAQFTTRQVNIASSAVIGGFRSAAITPTFPAAFAAAPAVVTFSTGGTGSGGDAVGAAATVNNTPATTTTNFSFYLAASQSTAVAACGYVAIGRWY